MKRKRTLFNQYRLFAVLLRHLHSGATLVVLFDHRGALSGNAVSRNDRWNSDTCTSFTGSLTGVLSAGSDGTVPTACLAGWASVGWLSARVGDGDRPFGGAILPFTDADLPLGDRLTRYTSNDYTHWLGGVIIPHIRDIALAYDTGGVLLHEVLHVRRHSLLLHNQHLNTCVVTSVLCRQTYDSHAYRTGDALHHGGGGSGQLGRGDADGHGDRRLGGSYHHGTCGRVRE